MSIRERIFRIVDEDARDYRPSRIFNGAIVVLIVLNVVAIIFESDDDLAIRYKWLWDEIELYSVIVFGLEYLMRLFTADFRYAKSKGVMPFLRYIISPLAIIDLLAIAPSILIIVAPYYSPLSQLMDLRFIRLLRTMRLLRIFKITRYSNSLRLIGSVLREKRRDLGVTIFIVFIMIIISSTLMYHVEHEAQSDQFPNILSTFWWAVATLTTVGYGDVFPITGMGKLLSGIIAILGIGLVALPTGILSSAFVERMEERKARERDAKKEEARESEGDSGPEISYCPYCGERLPHSKAHGAPAVDPPPEPDG